MEYSYFDTHAHMDQTYGGCLEKVLSECQNCGVKKIVVPPISFDSNFIINEMFSKEEYKNFIYQAVGLHPRCAINEPWSRKKAERLEKLLECNNVVAIKTGVDFCKVKLEERQKESQLKFLKYFIKLAAKHRLPLIIHVRDAMDSFIVAWLQTMEEIEQLNKDIEDESQLYVKPKTVIHCYNGFDSKMTEQLLSMGIEFFGIGGKITGDDEALVDSVRNMPKESILLETDSPWVCPKPYVMPEYLMDYIVTNKIKVKLNTPATLPVIAKKIAEIRNCTPEEIMDLTYNNGCRFFNLNALGTGV